jgi:hypothetical protein
MSKYHAQRTEVDGIKFASKKEATRYVQLKAFERVGIIKNLRLQVPFVIIAKSRYGRAIKYVADFVYDEDGQMVVEDVKSKATITPVYKLKKRLVAEVYGIEITEV